MQTRIKIGEKIYQIEILELEENLLKVRVNQKDYFFTKNEFGGIIPVEKESIDFGVLTKESEVIWETLAEKEIKSPIAGTISAIYVKEGDKIRPNQKVATLISMKMENEIISETSGVVKEIKVKENQFVKSNDVLIVLE